VRRLAEAIGAYAGLDPPPWLLEARVRERAEELGLDVDDYIARMDERERATLLERLRVGETRFFRHRAQIAALKSIISSLRAPVRAWSAGCASGEEAFTLAILLGDCEVIGTDLSASAIAFAERARWPIARLAEIPDEYRVHFVIDGDGFSPRAELRSRVKFQQRNLLEGNHPRAIDLVLCRNVLIYFDAERRAAAIARLSDGLRAGGWLCLGYSEALRGQEEARLEPQRIGETVLYRRRDITAKIELPPREEPAEEIVTNQSRFPAPAGGLALRAQGEVTPESPPTSATGATTATATTVVKLRGEYADGTRLQSELRPFLAGEAVIDLDGAEFLGDEAARVLQRAKQAAPRWILKATRPAILRWLRKHDL
jgi:chemotaxis methyl-accepting protein methylase